MNSNDPYRNWPHAVLIAIDQLGNALAGGHPVTTISARVGYFSENSRRGKLYWQCLESLIDFAFYPIDGPNHCRKAWKSDTHKLYRIGSDVTRVILSLLILVINPFIALFLRLTVLIYPKWRYKK